MQLLTVIQEKNIVYRELVKENSVITASQEKIWLSTELVKRKYSYYRASKEKKSVTTELVKIKMSY